MWFIGVEVEQEKKKSWIRPCYIDTLKILAIFSSILEDRDKDLFKILDRILTKSLRILKEPLKDLCKDLYPDCLKIVRRSS